MMEDIFSAVKFAIDSGLLVDELLHGLVSAIFSAFLYYKTKSFKHSIIPIVITYVMDLDHFVDYLLYFGFDISLLRFFEGNYFHDTNRAIIPFHAWEWVFVLLLIVLFGKARKWKSYKVSLMFGIASHLVWDTYRIGFPLFYSIIYRIMHNFTNLL